MDKRNEKKQRELWESSSMHCKKGRDLLNKRIQSIHKILTSSYCG